MCTAREEEGEEESEGEETREPGPFFCIFYLLVL